MTMLASMRLPFRVATGLMLMQPTSCHPFFVSTKLQRQQRRLLPSMPPSEQAQSWELFGGSAQLIPKLFNTALCAVDMAHFAGSSMDDPPSACWFLPQLRLPALA